MPHIELNSSSDDVASKIPVIRECMGQRAVVLVWASWCPHCVTLKPNWNKFRNSVDKRINVIEIESQNLDKIRDKNKALFKKLYSDENRVFYPMIKSFSNNKGRVYEDERTSKAMKSFFEKDLVTEPAKPIKKNTKSKDKPKPKPKQSKKGGMVEEHKKKLDKHVEGFIEKWGL